VIRALPLALLAWGLSLTLGTAAAVAQPATAPGPEPAPAPSAPPATPTPVTLTLTVDASMIRGAAAAPVTILEFSDYQCPFCKRAQPVLERLLAEFPGKVRIVFKDYPLDFHEGARPAAEAARCAGAAGRYWDYHDLLFLAQPAFSRDDLITYAHRVGLDRTAFSLCLDARRFGPAVEADVAEGRALGVSGTPTFFVNGRRLVGAHPIETFREAVDDALADAGRK
jgi:protein-disulfide isomerase